VADASTSAIARDGQAARPAQPPRPDRWAWLGLIPFLLFSITFLFLPVAFLVVGSFTTTQGAVTLDNYTGLQDDYIVTAYLNSIRVSAITAIGGGLFGFLLASSVILGGLPGFLRTALMTFSGVASNFAGIPLALAFVFTLGNVGLATVFIEDAFGISLRDDLGFNLYGIAGLSLAYMYFQFPLMVLIIAPAIEGLRREWREASDNLGASRVQYWRHVGLPILTPAILGTMILLFGNAFGAQATAFKLTGGSFPLATLVISAQIRGDVLHNPGLGYAMAMGMVLIMGVSILAYSWLQRRAERWLRS
jgi:putative spermidine/putrescine transport system permease protein